MYICCLHVRHTVRHCLLSELPFAAQVWSATISLCKCQATLVKVCSDKQLQKTRSRRHFTGNLEGQSISVKHPYSDRKSLTSCRPSHWLQHYICKMFPAYIYNVNDERREILSGKQGGIIIKGITRSLHSFLFLKMNKKTERSWVYFVAKEWYKLIMRGFTNNFCIYTNAEPTSPNNRPEKVCPH